MAKCCNHCTKVAHLKQEYHTHQNKDFLRFLLHFPVATPFTNLLWPRKHRPAGRSCHDVGALSHSGVPVHKCHRTVEAYISLRRFLPKLSSRVLLFFLLHQPTFMCSKTIYARFTKWSKYPWSTWMPGTYSPSVKLFRTHSPHQSPNPLMPRS